MFLIISYQLPIISEYHHINIFILLLILKNINDIMTFIYCKPVHYLLYFISSYRLCRKVIEDCKSAKDPKAYRSKHQAEYQLHDSLKKSFRIWALPKSQALKKPKRKLIILNPNRLLPSVKSRNCKKS